MLAQLQQSHQTTRPQSKTVEQRSWERERRSERWAEELKAYNAALGFEDDLLFLPPSRR